MAIDAVGFGAAADVFEGFFFFFWRANISRYLRILKEQVKTRDFEEYLRNNLDVSRGLNIT